MGIVIISTFATETDQNRHFWHTASQSTYPKEQNNYLKANKCTPFLIFLYYVVSLNKNPKKADSHNSHYCTVWQVFKGI